MESGESLKGHLLIASAALIDPNFRQTVVLMVHHDSEGALGLVLNRSSDMALGELWEKIASSPCQSEQLLNFGGPVEGPLMAVHTHKDLSESEILPGVYFSVQKDNLNEIVTREDNSFRVFVGNAGWAGGQLEAELEQGSWYTLEASPSHVFGNDEDLWQTVFRAATRAKGLAQLFNVKHVPPDPRLN